MSLCTHTMGQPFFSGAIPIYGVLPYSMIMNVEIQLLDLTNLDDVH